jgi:GntR family transcriptional repressor for pyruvate dehydrogenase complex
MIAKVNAKNKTNMIVEKVLDMIVQGEYKVGEQLPPENVLSREFGVSRTTLRESFKQLSVMGIITIRQGEGTFVNRISPSNLIEPLMPLMLLDMNDSDIDEIYEARSCLESSIAQIAATKRTEEDIDELRNLLNLMDACLLNEDFEHYSQLDLQFHTKIAEASKNRIMISMYMMLNEVRTRSIRISNLGHSFVNYSIMKHKEIFNALDQRDVINIASIVNTHLAFSRQINMKAIHSTKTTEQKNTEVQTHV